MSAVQHDKIGSFMARGFLRPRWQALRRSVKWDVQLWSLAGVTFLLIAIRDRYFPGFLGQNSAPPWMFGTLGTLLIGLSVWSFLRSGTQH